MVSVPVVLPEKEPPSVTLVQVAPELVDCHQRVLSCVPSAAAVKLALAFGQTEALEGCVVIVPGEQEAPTETRVT